MIVEYLSPKPWALICCFNSFHPSGKVLHNIIESGYKTCCHPDTTASVRSARDVGQEGLICSWCSNSSHGCWMGSAVKALCRFIHTKLTKPFLYGPGFAHGSIVMLKQERGKNLLQTVTPSYAVVLRFPFMDLNHYLLQTLQLALCIHTPSFVHQTAR